MGSFHENAMMTASGSRVWGLKTRALPAAIHSAIYHCGTAVDPLYANALSAGAANGTAPLGLTSGLKVEFSHPCPSDFNHPSTATCIVGHRPEEPTDVRLEILRDSRQGNV